ncbi:hypothetical protein ABIA32_000605 [Streptacidiphilus sp. MAP12-20]|uniref:DUF2690 domain-containing protein n=1 Tax=Streptacidiphilus sp. MAP12-20 TaxID=3156299 RepID=UPI003517A539
MRLTTLAKRAAVVTTSTVILAAGFTGNANALAYDGADPNGSGCSADAITAASVPLGNGGYSVYGTMELRYSPYCRTVWARVWSDGTELFAQVHRNSDDATQSCGTPTWSSSAGRYYCYTAMLNDANVTSYAWGYASYYPGPGDASVTGHTSNY